MLHPTTLTGSQRSSCPSPETINPQVCQDDIQTASSPIHETAVLSEYPAFSTLQQINGPCPRPNGHEIHIALAHGNGSRFGVALIVTAG